MSDKYTRTRVKICGLTRPEDVLAAVNLGVDAVGMVFYPGSKRYMDLSRAKQLRKLIPAFVSCTALFVNPDKGFVNQVIQELQPDVLQFHGDESEQFCGSFTRPYIKAFRVGGPDQDTAENLIKFCARYQSAAAWLFDSYTPAYGGSGQSFEIDLLAAVIQADNRPAIILSGGLDTVNVAGRISLCHPFAVDVSSAVESAPGIKDREKMAAFMQAIQNADNIVK